MGSYYFKIKILSLFAVLICTLKLSGQQTQLKGHVIDIVSGDDLFNVEIRVNNSALGTSTNTKGWFSFAETELPLGENILEIKVEGFVTQRLRIEILTGKEVNLDPILLRRDPAAIASQIAVISLSDEELDQDEGTVYNISGLLQASRDVFYNAAAYDFSAAFFRPRGFDNAYGKVLINGIEMNRLYDSRPQWNNWGGLNDAQRNREFVNGIRANDYDFGDLAGTTNIDMRASSFSPGGRLSYALANRSYTGRVMVSYNSGLKGSNWAYSVLVSRRFAEEGYIDGTLYDANSFFLALEKKLSPHHSLNLTAFYTPNRRGRSTALTEEVKNLKGATYNPQWGIQDGTIRNSRMRRAEEPIVMLNHYWDFTEKTGLNTNLAYRFGSSGNTRLEYSGQRNPAGNYYQRLPSYFLRNNNPTPYDFQLAYLAEQELIRDGQLNWPLFYQANRNSDKSLSKYVIQEDVVQDKELIINSILRTELSEHIILSGKLNFRSLESENFAQLEDLLGGAGYLDVDYFGSDPLQIQSDLQYLDRIAREGDRFRYNYKIVSNAISSFLQARFDFRRAEYHLGVTLGQTSYQRLGLFQNGYFPEPKRSLGGSERVNFTDYGIKSGISYRFNGRHHSEFNGTYHIKAPSIKEVFANVRQNNDIVEGIQPQNSKAVDLSYFYRSPLVKARFTAYYATIEDQTRIGFFFTQNALGNDENSAFVQEITQGLNESHLGVEFGIEAQFLPTLKIKAAVAAGQFTYSNNPDLYLAGDDFDDVATPEYLEGNDLHKLGFRKAKLKNYHLANGPHHAYQIGFEYRATDYWWVGVTTNYFSHAYVDLSKLRRTPDFYSDTDGLPFNDYNSKTAKSLLKQEKLDDYFLVNAIGGKSWRIKGYYIGFFALVNNLLNTAYKTGGFEDSRRASFRQQLEEQGREYGPIFGNRYFYGYGTSFYLNVYLRF